MKIILLLVLVFIATAINYKTNSSAQKRSAQMAELKTISSSMENAAHDKAVLEKFYVEVEAKISLATMTLKELDKMYFDTMDQLKTENGKRDLVWIQLAALYLVKE